MAAFTLAHLSDPHLPPLPEPRASELAGKRVLGYLNWRRNRHKYHRREVLDALVSDLRAQSPDHIAVTGDLVNLDLYVRATRYRFAETFSDYLASDGTSNATRFPFLRKRGPLALISLSS